MTRARTNPTPRAELFPADLPSTPPGSIEQYAYLISRLAIPRYGAELAEVHRRALAAGNEPVAQLCRSVEALSDVSEAGTVGVPPSMAAPAAERARRAYQVACAEQLVAADHELADAAREFLAAVEAEAAAAAETERARAIEAEEAAAAELERKAAASRVLVERIAEVSAASDAFKAASAEAERAGRAYRDLKAQVLVERIAHSGTDSLRLGNRVWAASMIVNMIDNWGVEQLAEFEAALEQHEAKAS